MWINFKTLCTDEESNKSLQTAYMKVFVQREVCDALTRYPTRVKLSGLDGMACLKARVITCRRFNKQGTVLRSLLFSFWRSNG